ncbi:sugar transferase, partial [Patescibacteria group bacterium]|nr:sugar transferase [Patescibacteria group bacterium]
MVYDFFKRVIDIVGSIILSIIFLPFCLLTAIAIALDSRGPIFADTPKRVGNNGKLFKLYKFRSMIMNAHKILRKDPKMARLYQQYRQNSYKLTYDPRVTSVGHFIRKHSIDEIPQLFNVIKGDMSLVGPRPYYQDELKE